MWAEMLHLVFGNFLIGIGEGLVLAGVFKLRVAPAIGIMIAANYASAWIGLAWLEARIVQVLELDLYNAWRWVWIMAVVSYFITLLIEWPFVALCFRKTPGILRRGMLGCLLVQTLSYVLLFGWYWGASGKSLYTKGDILAPGDFELSPGIAVYHIGKDDGDVHEFDFDTRRTRLVAPLGSTNLNDRLAIWPARTGQDSYGIVARLDAADQKPPVLRDVLGGLAARQVAVEAGRDAEVEATWSNFGPVPRVGNTAEGDFYAGFWPIEGLASVDPLGKVLLHLAFETPWAAWSIRNATELPSGEVVFQLGEDQICILEPASRKVARFVFGRGPVVVLKSAPAGQGQPARHKPLEQSGRPPLGFWKRGERLPHRSFHGSAWVDPHDGVRGDVAKALLGVVQEGNEQWRRRLCRLAKISERVDGSRKWIGRLQVADQGGYGDFWPAMNIPKGADRVEAHPWVAVADPQRQRGDGLFRLGLDHAQGDGGSSTDIGVAVGEHFDQRWHGRCGICPQQDETLNGHSVRFIGLGESN